MSVLSLFASCQEGSKELSKDKKFFIESKDSVLGCFQFKIKTTFTDVVFQKNGEKFDGDPILHPTMSLDLIRSGDSLFIKQQTEIIRDKYGRPTNVGYQTKFFTVVKDGGNLDESLAIQNINKEELFDLGILAEKITVQDSK